MLSRVIAKNTM